MDHFTLDELASFSQLDQDFSRLLGQDNPRESSVNNILSYSAGLSVKKSKRLDYISLVLN